MLGWCVSAIENSEIWTMPDVESEFNELDPPAADESVFSDGLGGPPPSSPVQVLERLPPLRRRPPRWPESASRARETARARPRQTFASKDKRMHA